VGPQEAQMKLFKQEIDAEAAALAKLDKCKNGVKVVWLISHYPTPSQKIVKSEQ